MKKLAGGGGAVFAMTLFGKVSSTQRVVAFTLNLIMDNLKSLKTIPTLAS